jgi:hypothetical protein
MFLNFLYLVIHDEILINFYDLKKINNFLKLLNY